MKTTPLGIIATALLGFSAPLAQGAKVSVSFFYDALEPYGDWMQTADYGYVWHPHDVDANWRPYTAGNWAYTDAGWTWVSTEPFGWATYHYGRWANLDREGWVWVPDTEWAPAWVSWRDNDRYVGWAPLPPEARFEVNVGFKGWVDSYYDIGPTAYSFVAVRDFGSPHLREVVVEPRQNITIINETRNITQITSNRNVIVNEGPRFDVVSRASAQPIRRLRLERQVDVDTAVTAGRSERFASQVSGDSLRVVAPEMEAGPGLAPKRVAQRLDRVEVNRGWRNAGDPQQVQQLRQRIASEEKAPAGLPARANLKGSTEPAAATPNARPGTNTAETPDSRRAPTGQPTPRREAATPEPGATPAPGATEAPGNPPKPGQPGERNPRNSRQPGAERPGQERDVTPPDPGASKNSREGNPPGNSRRPDTREPETTKPQPGAAPDSPERPGKADSRKPGQRPSTSDNDRSETDRGKLPTIEQGPGRRGGKTETNDATPPRERKEPGNEAAPGKKPAAPEEPKAEPHRPKAEPPSNDSDLKGERRAAPEQSRAPQREDAAADEGAKRKTPPPKAEQHNAPEKSEGLPAAEKRPEGNTAERKETPKGAEKKDKDKN